MAKKRSTRRAEPQRATNWYLIIGIAGVFVVFLFTLVFLTVGGSPDPIQGLAQFCADNPTNCVTQGNPDAPVTMVAIEDFACSHCRDFHVATLPRIQQDYVAPGDVKLVALPYALRPETTPAAAASLCAAEQNAYFEFSAAMFAAFGQPETLTRSGYIAIADSLGLDNAAFSACVADGRYTDIIQENQAAASANGIRSTPNFFINGVLLEGNRPYANFQQQIAQFLGS